MSERNTRAEILETALTMFADHGYNTVSIRDISGAVHIKESSIYYHFLNKRAILETLLEDFSQRATSLNTMIMQGIDQAFSGESTDTGIDFATAVADNLPIFKWLTNYYCDKFLLDPFCNKIMRILTLEQFHDEELAARYTEWMFERPLTVQLEAVRRMGGPDLAAVLFNSCVTRLIFRYLLNGQLTDECRQTFKAEMTASLTSLIKLMA